MFPFFSRVKRNHYSSGQNAYKDQYNRNEGDVTIDHIPEKKKKIDKDEGDYIEFEEM